ncbi:terminase family protein [Sphingomonas sp. TREG-RG-20F-R18-01]|uniref:DNA-packaging protein n=1 Tax=Sphingomonas sp. TREG-RG-20F-R18-01 TaxID=2914982 RepID=UPI001F5839A4|nr:terminase family protein [Sphingomonas sp. TREG-RG-20F-R18-01]
MSGGVRPPRRGTSGAIAGLAGPSAAAWVERVLALSDDERAELLRGLSAPQRRTLNDAWVLWAHPGQVAPPGDWQIWLIRAGRGFGKTRAGAEWVSEIARSTPHARIALVGATIDDVRRVMIEGESGLVSVARIDEPVDYRRGAGEIVFASGARAAIFSAASPEALRGPEHHAAWCDELAKWRYGDVAWDNLMLGMRIGDRPRVLVTTTPRPIPLLRRVMALKGLVETVGRTQDNPHLPAAFLAALEDAYGGTRLARQELAGELIEEAEGALWTRAQFDACRVAAAPALVRTIVAVDPPAGTESGRGDACGIVAVGLGRDGRGYVLEDASVSGLMPEGWAHAVAACAARHRADRVIAERNQGGKMVESVLLAADAGLPLRLVHAAKGKVARAEPVSILYERGKVSHVGVFPALETELCGLVVGGGYQGPTPSPDRADALVWALGDLLITATPRPRVRGLAGDP